MFGKGDGEKTHFHIVVWAAESKIDANNYTGVTFVDVIASSMDDAVKKARKLCPGRQFYWVNNIIEHHNEGEIKE